MTNITDKELNAKIAKLIKETGGDVTVSTIMGFRNLINKQAKQETLDSVMELVPEEIDCDEPGQEMPTDPGLAADQAMNYTIRELRTNIKKLM